MLTDATKRMIAAYMLSPRIRETGVMKDNKMTYAEDAQIAALFKEFEGHVKVEEARDAYYAYLQEIAIELDKSRNSALPRLADAKHDDKLREISGSFRAQADITRRVPSLASYVEDLMNRDIGKIRTALKEMVAAGRPIETEHEARIVADFTPIGYFDYNPAQVAIADMTVNQGTGGTFRSVEAMLTHIRAAEDEIKRLKTAVPVERDPTPGTYTATRRKAKDVFKQALRNETLNGNDLNFDVTVFEWTNPHPTIPEIDPDYTFKKKDLRELLWCIENGKNSVLVGPTGCGKTTATEQIAARLKRPFFRVPIDGEMRKREIIGGFKQVVEDGRSVTRWFDGIVIEALKWPAILDMDEIDRADPDLQYVAHQIYEGKGVTILEDEGRRVQPNKYFGMIATANTKGRADGMNIYNLTAEMSEATRDRFPFWIDWDYMEEKVERETLKRKHPTLKDVTIEKIVQIANGLRACLTDGKIRTATSFRQVETCASYAQFLETDLGHTEADARVLAIHKVMVSRAGDENEVAVMTEVAKKALGSEWESRMKPTKANASGQP
jgi:MoxR-like ATPase